MSKITLFFPLETTLSVLRSFCEVLYYIFRNFSVELFVDDFRNNCRLRH